MDFEWNPQKSKANFKKHGIDFSHATKLWNSPIVEIPVANEGEKRFLVIGKLLNKTWTAVITYRGEKTRIISCRRSRKNEEAIYQKEIGEENFG